MEAVNGALRRVPTWCVYVALALPAPYLLSLALTGGLGVDPVKALEHQLGRWALWLLLAGLAVSPLRNHFHLNLLKFRRALGLMAFYYVVLHLLVWLVLDVQIVSQIWADIVKRPYITVGMLAFICMVPLAATSTNAAIRRLGSKWRRLHRLTYLIVPLGALHFVMVAKGFQIEPLLYLAAAVLLVALRAPLKRRRGIKA
ncbi:protein-methionine-sulfoxide reductase heme-binding subunit MsrQ [Sagittula sp. SSi028]|uniref:protein-methionine-sulfoxide reductase heme-binding subunit MsrQ n=1 Tax=Sagittula sp. SSi028 TaxID=3400636 RepID=UPI003AF66DBF